MGPFELLKKKNQLAATCQALVIAQVNVAKSSVDQDPLLVMERGQEVMRLLSEALVSDPAGVPEKLFEGATAANFDAICKRLQTIIEAAAPRRESFRNQMAKEEGHRHVL